VLSRIVFLEMLLRLHIQNYTLIEELNVDFRSGLSILTGETGSGKSIMLGAIHLLLGERADIQALRIESQKCVIEASFDIQAYQLREYFELHDLDFEPQVIMRREINPAGKSRAFINDTPVTLSRMKDLGRMLVDIHSQHDTLLLSDARFRMQLLDAVAANESLLLTYKSKFNERNTLVNQLEKRTEDQKKLQLDNDYNAFQFNELSELKLQPGEFTELEEAYKRLSHSSEITEQLNQCAYLIEESDENILSKFRLVKQALLQASKYSDSYQSLNTRIDSLIIELKDISSEINLQAQELESDPQTLVKLEQRLDLIQRALFKHGVSNADDLIERMNYFKMKLDSVDDISLEIEELKNAIHIIEKELKLQAQKISLKRQSVTDSLSKQIEAILKRLGMPDARIEFKLEQQSQFLQNGIDTLQILFSANKGQTLAEMSKTASGGELSRLMLAIKRIIAKSIKLPTIIFDEIDTGVSGKVADAMGEVLREMGDQMQVIAITHLPQIASKGHDHFKVVKETENNQTVSRLIRLDNQPRIDEIAAMLSGKTLSDAAIYNARQLLGLEETP